MDVTKKCVISGKDGFNSVCKNRFAIVYVEAGNGDIIKVNEVNGIKYSEIWAAFEYPNHDEQPIIDNQNKIIIVGGEARQSQRTITIMGK